MNPSVHDNHLIAYTVLQNEKRIVMQTTSPYRKPHQFVDVIFEDVLAYYFEHDVFGCILFDVCEIDTATLLKEEAARFEDGRWMWPRGWEREKESLETYVGRIGVVAFEVSSSYGMSGWVLAKSMSKIRKEEGQKPAATP